MQFIQRDPVTAGQALRAHLETKLTAGQRVLWLVSGGSNIAISVAVMQALPDELTNQLTVLPVDERFGEPDHADSNWHQLAQAGFPPKQAKLLPVLQNGQSFESAGAYFESLASEAYATTTYYVAQLGIGADGHIAGILPQSPALQETQHLVAAYESPPYQRLTLTLTALERVSTAYVFAYGQDKRAALEALRDQDLPISTQPGQFLKQLKQVFIYNDQLGEQA